MTDSPFKPPGRIGAAGESAQPQRPGMVPTPPVAPQQRKRGAIPGGAPLARPVRPANVLSESGEDQAATDRWAYNYTGNAAAGAPPSEDGGFDSIPPFKPAIELPEPRPLTVLFYQDVQAVQVSTEPISQNFNGVYTFDDSAQNADGLAPGRFRVSETDTDQPYSSFIYLALPEPWETSPTDFLDRATQPKIRISYGGDSYFYSKINEWEIIDGTPRVLQLTVDSIDAFVNETDGPLDDAQAVGVEFDGLRIPNAAVRARVRYRSGPSDITFDCDWAGGFQVYAERLEIQRVAFQPDVQIPFADAAVTISATVQADAPRPGGSLSLTVIPVRVPTLTGKRFYSFPVHSLARRVCLMLKYGASEDLPGDAPLGQIFLAFVGKFGRSLCYIDAMSAREALFGAGLPIPAGTSQLVVSNRSDDDTMLIGLIWRLEL